MSNTIEQPKAEIDRQNKEGFDALFAETGYAECRWSDGSLKRWLRKNDDGTIDSVGQEIFAANHIVPLLVEDFSKPELYIFAPSTKKQFDAALAALFKKMKRKNAR